MRQIEKQLDQIFTHNRWTRDEILAELNDFFNVTYEKEINELPEYSRVKGQDNALQYFYTEYYDEDMNSGEDIEVLIWYLNTNEQDIIYVTEVSVHMSEF